MKQPETEPKTWGTVVAKRNRAKANRLTDTDRSRLLARGLQLIYGAEARVRAKAHRS